MANLGVQPATPAGTTPNYVAANAGGDSFPPGDDVIMIVKAGATGATVTVASPTPCNQGSTHPLVVTVAPNTERHIGPLSAGRYADPATGLVSVTYSQVSTITVAAVVA